MRWHKYKRFVWLKSIDFYDKISWKAKKEGQLSCKKSLTEPEPNVVIIKITSGISNKRSGIGVSNAKITITPVTSIFEGPIFKASPVYFITGN